VGLMPASPFFMNLIITFLIGIQALAASVCTIDFPNRELKRIFPTMTSFRMRDLIPARHGGADVLKKIEKEIESPLDPEFDTLDTPHSFYLIYKGSEYLGVIQGLNIRGASGPMQVFVAYQRSGQIADVFVQKISSKDAPAFRSKYYRQQFKPFGLNRAFELADIKPPVRSPSAETIKDHHAFIRGVRLNILYVRYLYNDFNGF